MRWISRLFIISFACLSLMTSAYANLFGGTVTVDGQQKTYSFKTIQEAVDSLSDGQLAQEFPGYNDNSNVNGDLNVRGIPISFDYVGTTLNIDIPSLGIHEVFTGDNRDAAENQFNNWLKGEGDAQVTKLFKGFVSNTAYDPVAGNPTSLMARMLDNDFDIATQAHLRRYAGITHGYNLFSFAPTYSDYTVGGTNVHQYNIPIKDSLYFNGGKSAFIFDMPITYIDEDGTSTYSAQLGLAFAQAINKFWSLIPAFHVGAVGSVDLGSGTVVYDASLSSRTEIPIGQFEVGMTNTFDWLKTQNVQTGAYNINYDLTNWGFKNGLDGQYHFKNVPIALGLSYSYAVMFGDKWYIPDYNEVGFNFINTAKHNGTRYDFLTLGVDYQFAPHFDGYNVVLGMNF